MTSQIVLGPASLSAGPSKELGSFYQLQIHMREKQNSIIMLTICGVRMIFQERPPERGIRKVKTVVLREHDLKGMDGSAKQRSIWHSSSLFYLAKLLGFKQF